MPISEAKLLTRLNKTEDPRKRIAMLLDLASANYRTDGKKSLAFAEEAYQLAVHVCDLSLQVKSLNIIADSQFYIGNTQTSLQTYETALAMADLLPETEKVDMLIGIAHPLSALGDMARALEFLKVGLEIEERHGFRTAGVVIFLQLGRIHFQLSNYTAALEYSTRALLLAKEQGDRQNESRALNRIGLIYSDTGEREKALATFFEDCELNRQLNDQYGVETALGNIGILYYEIGENKLSLKYYNEALQIQRANGNIIHQIYTYCNIGNTCINLRDLTQAHENVETALNLLNSIDYHEYAQITTYVYYARVLNKCCQYDKALEYALMILPLMKDGRRQEMYTMALEEIIEAYEQKGELASALRYQKELLAHKTRVLKLQSEADLKMMTMRHEIQRKEEEKEAYRSKALELEQELKINIQSVARLGQEVIDKNEFLTSIKQKVQALLPTANGSERALRSFVKEIEAQIASGDAHLQFDAALKQLQGDFIVSLAQKYPDLTSAERKVCSLIKLGFNSHQIAELLFTSIRTAEGHRLKIRRKLMISGQIDIKIFLDQI